MFMLYNIVSVATAKIIKFIDTSMSGVSPDRSTVAKFSNIIVRIIVPNIIPTSQKIII